jgi:hypothetical protein
VKQAQADKVAADEAAKAAADEARLQAKIRREEIAREVAENQLKTT